KAHAAARARTFAELERAARAALRREGFNADKQRHEHSVAARYKGQSFELEIKYRPRTDLAAAFHRAHAARYGYAQTENAVEIVSARVRSAGLVEKLRAERARGHARRTTAAPQRFVPVYFTNK